MYCIVPCWRYLLGYRPRHSIFHTLYCRLHRRYYNLQLQTNSSLSLTVLTVHPFRRLSWPSTISVGARQFTVDSRPSLSLLSPSTDCCLRRLAHWLFVSLPDSDSSPAGSLTDCRLFSEIPVLRWGCADGIVSTLSHVSFLHCDGLVTGETSVVHSQCTAVGLFSE
jgi:hypothetical protein